MLLLLQIALYCAAFVLLVRCAAGNSGRNCLYFYPKEFIEEAERRGISQKAAVMRKGKRFMIAFCAVMLVLLLLILTVWNRVTEFKTAYVQASLLLVVTNWFDGIVVDRLWVGHGRLWRIEGMEGVPYVKPWKDVLLKRSAATALYLVLALAVAGIAVWIGKAL